MNIQVPTNEFFDMVNDWEMESFRLRVVKIFRACSPQEKSDEIQ